MAALSLTGRFAQVTVGQVLAYTLSFVRNLILARVLSIADFGLAAIFSLALAMFELTGRLALGKQVIQSADGDSERFMSTAHAFQFLAGGINAIALLALCVPMAHLFKVPEKAWAFAFLSLFPLLRGLGNLDLTRRQRQFDFMPSIWAEIIPQAIVTAVAWPLAKWIGDFRVVLVLVFGKELLYTILSHGLAKRSYRWAWDVSLVPGMWRFSWPLIINGLLIFAAQQGDQMIVGGAYSLGVLGLYAAGASLISAPFFVIAHASSSLMLPLLSPLQRTAELFLREYRICVQLCAVGAAVTMAPFVVAGEQILKLVYGDKFIGAGSILALLAVACAFRFLRIAPATAALARADTQNQMISNLCRIISVALAGGMAIVGAAVEMVAASAVIGEIAALVASSYRLKSHQGVAIREAWRPFGYLAANLSLAWGMVWAGIHNWSLFPAAGMAVLTVGTSLISAYWLFPFTFDRAWNSLVRTFFFRSALSNKQSSGQ
jgi:O-antigen/teichoic acid export membrane protein